MFLVGLNLVVGLPDVSGFVGGVFQFNQHQRQAIDEQDDVGAAGVVRAFDGELVDGPEFITGRFSPIDQAHKVAHCFTVSLVLHRHAAHQKLVEGTVGCQQRRNTQVQHPLQGVFTGSCGNVGVQPQYGLPQAERQHHLPVVCTLGVRPVVGNVVAAVDRITQLGQPGQGFLFELVFGHLYSPCWSSRIWFSAKFT